MDDIQLNFITAQRELAEVKAENIKLEKKIDEQNRLAGYFGKDRATQLPELERQLVDAKSRLAVAERNYRSATSAIAEIEKSKVVDRLKLDWAAAGNNPYDLTPEKLDRLYEEYQRDKFARNLDQARQAHTQLLRKHF